MICRRPPTALRSLVQILTVALLGSALSSPLVLAAERKDAPAKKAKVSVAAATPQGKSVVKAASSQPARKSVAKTTERAPVVVSRNARGAAANKMVALAPPPKGRGKAAQRAALAAAAATAATVVAAKPSFGELAGLHHATDPLELKSSVALVIDQDTQEVLLRKNEQAILPIASLTKLMTGLLISEARLPMHEPITITQEDVDTEKGSRSRLSVGTTLTRQEMLHLALMSSENRAANALGRTYPGGLGTFVAKMNAKARQLGMADTRYVEPTGLSSNNQSSARDLAMLVNVASRDPLLREFSTSPGHEVAVGQRTLQYNNTNRLVKNPDWDTGLQKTGYIAEAGRCLVMQTKVAGRKLIMVFLDSAGKYSRLGDAERVRNWVEARQHSLHSAANRTQLQALNR
ncbi:D-alanyl-D-alanine endopeptidase (penicillin-binding protein 7) [Giesbergeria anulus]|uniref:D-alanyl-D-alanine endopeptidase (Penicillin-binding protein 7) n=1 Tax=Giesbergeria anulus TaxID=180197 RepID=A0A1H9G0D0_9BURK|nr:D-alanyl-D-alanine endopeptidase (penicillin-binding protein 7) [Giesbergeria anulus]